MSKNLVQSFLTAKYVPHKRYGGKKEAPKVYMTDISVVLHMNNQQWSFNWERKLKDR